MYLCVSVGVRAYMCMYVCMYACNGCASWGRRECGQMGKGQLRGGISVRRREVRHRTQRIREGGGKNTTRLKSLTYVYVFIYVRLSGVVFHFVNSLPFFQYYLVVRV